MRSIMTVHDYFALLILVQLVLFALAFGQLERNHPIEHNELGGSKALLGFLSTMRFITFFMALRFLRMSEKPVLTNRELIIYFGFFISSWITFVGLVWLLVARI